MAKSIDIDKTDGDWLTHEWRKPEEKDANWLQAMRLPIYDGTLLKDWLNERRIPIDLLLASPISHSLSEDVRKALVESREEVK